MTKVQLNSSKHALLIFILRILAALSICIKDVTFFNN